MAVKNPFLYTEVNTGSIPKSTFDMGHEVKFTANAGLLYPCMYEEVLPGDTFKHKVSMFSRLEPLAVPMMQNVNMFSHSFYVPNRIVWDNWNDFIRRGDDGETEYNAPYITLKGVYNWIMLSTGSFTPANRVPILKRCFGENSLMSYMGIPALIQTEQEWLSMAQGGASLSEEKINSMPFRAYIYIWNEYYRDENIQYKIPFRTGDGDDSEWFGALYYNNDPSASEAVRMMKNGFLPRCWQKDYFTSALPFVQKGDPVSIKLVDDEIVSVVELENSSNREGFFVTATGESLPSTFGGVYIDKFSNSTGRAATTAGAGSPPVNLQYDPNGTLYSKIASGSFNSITVADFRKALRLQWFKEKNAQFGNRIKEFVYSHFGINIPDERLQEPEYLAGFRSTVNVSDIAQSSPTTESVSHQGTLEVAGQLYGKGTCYGDSEWYDKYFPEHGMVITLFSILPEASYSQGLARKWSRRSSYDYAFPEFAPLGDQDIKAKELKFYHTSTPAHNAANEATFGYQGRYSEYKFSPNRICGEFLTTYSNWHMGRRFVGDAILNSEFLEGTDDTNFAPFAITDGRFDHYLVNVYHDLKVTRALPLYNTPTLL